MKLRNGITGSTGVWVVVVGVLFLAQAAGATTLITNEGGSGLRNDHQGTVGMVFRVGSQDLWATDLGIYDTAWNGLTTAHDVGLWRDITPTPVAAATVPAGTGATLEGAFRFVPTAPALLQANTYYVIGAQYPGGNSGDQFRDQNGGQVFDLTGLDPATNTRAARWVSGAALANPGTQASLNTAYVGANIKHVVAPVAAIQNLAPAGTATGSSEGYGTLFADANDGNRDGNYNNGSVWHATDPDTFPSYYQLDLGGRYHLDRVQVLPRTDARQATVENLRLTVYEDDGAGNPGGVSWSQDYLTAGSAADYGWAAAIPAGVAGRHVRMERLDNSPTFLTFAEFEVFGRGTPMGVNLAAGQPVTASPAGFGSAPGDGNDNDLNAHFWAAGFPVYHSATQAVGQYWQVDLGAMQDLEMLQLFQRGDGVSTSEFFVQVLADDAATVMYSAIVGNVPSYDMTLSLDGITGRYVRLETTKGEFLAFTELRVLGVPEVVSDIPGPTLGTVSGTGDIETWASADEFLNPPASPPALPSAPWGRNGGTLSVAVAGDGTVVGLFDNGQIWSWASLDDFGTNAGGTQLGSGPWGRNAMGLSIAADADGQIIGLFDNQQIWSWASIADFAANYGATLLGSGPWGRNANQLSIGIDDDGTVYGFFDNGQLWSWASLDDFVNNDVTDLGTLLGTRPGGDNSTNMTLFAFGSADVIPEPATIAMLSLAGVSLCGYLRRRRRR